MTNNSLEPFYTLIRNATSAKEYGDAWLKATTARSDMYVEIAGVKLFVPAKCFSPDPRLTNSSLAMVKHIQTLDLNGKSVLDIGTGPGTLSLIAAKNGAKKVVATDIDPACIEAVNRNVEEHGVSDIIEVLQSDGFENIFNNFDIIIGNLPFRDEGWEDIVISAKVLYSHFLTEAPNHLNADGTILTITASFADIDLIRSLVYGTDLTVNEFVDYKYHTDWIVFKLNN
jgi:methylase of polypeptide subunit release factors